MPQGQWGAWLGARWLGDEQIGQPSDIVTVTFAG
jgi:hypothetical protein